jgi:hypothetical protein
MLPLHEARGLSPSSNNSRESGKGMTMVDMMTEEREEEVEEGGMRKRM